MFPQACRRACRRSVIVIFAPFMHLYSHLSAIKFKRILTGVHTRITTVLDAISVGETGKSGRESRDIHY